MKVQPKFVEHVLFVVRLIKNTTNGKWFAVVVKDAIRVQVTVEFDSKEQALAAVKLK